MNVWNRVLAWFGPRRPRVIVVRGPEMAPAEIDEALGACLPEHPVWRAVNQLVDWSEQLAQRDSSAALHAGNGELAASYALVAEKCREFRDNLEAHRRRGRKAK